MKILRIRLKNLNSLKGDHSVDLTAEPLASAGLFAITGPMGAGKSTLLDAVTLALYGKAARYGSEANPEDVMSRHSGECSAEVEFEVASGIYRAVWVRHRARKKSDGALQAPKRYIYNQAGESLTQQIREAEDKIEKLLGLNYDRFLRSVLLAQGEFAKFLKANANERAELLESLTGTAIYSRLGKLAHDEANRRESELATKASGLDQIVILEHDARKELETAIQQNEQTRLTLANDVEAGSAMLSKIASLKEGRKKEEAATADQGQIQKDQQAALADLNRLRCHRLTLPFAEDLARLDAAETAMSSATKQKTQAEKNHANAKATLLRTNQTLRACIEAALKTQRLRAKAAGETLQKETKVAQDARAWLEAHQSDAVLADQLGDLVAGIGELKSARASLANQWADWRSSAAEVMPIEVPSLPASIQATTEVNLEAILDGFLGKVGKRKEALEEEGKAAKKQFGLREDHLSKAKLIAKLEAHRSDLQSGEPCPLCGALEHPYAEGSKPNREITELEDEVLKATSKLEETREAYRSLAATLKDLTTDRKNLITMLRDCDAHLKTLVANLKPLGIQPPVNGKEDELRQGINERNRTYLKNVKAEEDANKRMAEAERNAKSADAEAANFVQKLEKLTPLPVGAGLHEKVVDASSSVADAEEAHSSAVMGEKTTATQAHDRIEDAKTAEEKFQKLKQPLEEAVATSEFKTLASLREARIPPDVAREIKERENALKQRATATDALLKQAQTDIARFLDGKVLEGEAADAFQTRQVQLSRDSEKLVEEQTTRRNQIQADDSKRKLRQQREGELATDRTNLVVWSRIRELIGSHDGGKFRRYAQSISLDILTRHANRHLAKLSDRYRICRDASETLNLEIEDIDQAGVRRPMASLSGGESFLASLALALGLSDIAGRTVRIDSLFIDEGFGSLDPETLEVAISALESLRQDHKTVGIISHVGLLKERISTQIVVEKVAGGVSRIRIIPEEARSNHVGNLS